MISENHLKDVKKLLKKHSQGHLLAFWGQLTAEQRQGLLAQIEGLDFSAIAGLVSEYVKKPASAALSADIKPAPYYSDTPIGAEQERKYGQAGQLGKELISAGKVAAFIVAGGQGTRLGFEGPKGDFHISPVKNKRLFRIFAEAIAAVSKKYGAVCPWYVMTSRMNFEQTQAIFKSNDYFGLQRDDVIIFRQGTMPNFSFDGRLLMANQCTMSCSPDGHGGSLKALYESGALADMKKRGVEFISYFQVDNPLVNIFDPLFIGLHALDDAQMSSKAVAKTNPEEKVGVFGLVNGKIGVIEYSDLPGELAQKRNPDGLLSFGLGSIAIHIINRSFVEKLNEKGFVLPLHKAVKKIPHINENGGIVEPAEPNAIKLESFVFDALSLADKSIILETRRSEEFAPVKNASGPDSAETAKEMMVARAVNWLESAGVSVPRKPGGSPDCLIEIAPGFALEKGDVKSKLEQMPRIKAGDRIYLS